MKKYTTNSFFHRKIFSSKFNEKKAEGWKPRLYFHGKYFMMKNRVDSVFFHADSEYRAYFT